jgi:hypothetical protein
MSPSADVSSELLAQIRGQRMTVPPLDSLYQKWTHGINPLMDQVGPLVDDLVQTYVPSKEHLSHALASAFALFGAA